MQQLMSSFVCSITEAVRKSEVRMTEAIRESELRMTAMISSEVAKSKSDMNARFMKALKNSEVEVSLALTDAEGWMKKSVCDASARLEENIEALREDVETKCNAVEKHVAVVLETQRNAVERQVVARTESAVAGAVEASEVLCETMRAARGELEEKLDVLRKDIKIDNAALETSITAALKMHRTATEEGVNVQVESAVAHASAASENTFTSALRETQASTATKIGDLERSLDSLKAKVATLEETLTPSQTLEEKLSNLREDLKQSAGNLESRVDVLTIRINVMNGGKELLAKRLSELLTRVNNTNARVSWVESDIRSIK